MLNPFTPYLLYIKLGAVVLVIGALALQRHTLDELREDAALHKDAIQAYRFAQETNLDSIAVLRARIVTMVDERRRNAQVSDQAVARAQAYVATINATLATTTKELNDVYSKYPQTRAWGDVGIPARVADRLPGKSRPGKN